MKVQNLLVCIALALFQQMNAQSYELHNSINLNDLSDGRNTPDGITWYLPAPLNYGIYRTNGAWIAPNFQQLKLSFDTGIIIDGGSLYGRSGTFLQPTGGNVGIGTSTPEAKLDVNGTVQINGGANNFYGFGQSSSSKPIDIRAGSHYPYVFNWHKGLTFSAHSSYGGIRFYNQGYPDMFGTAVMVMSITNNNVGIGTTNPTSKLTVAGNINSREVKVTVDAGADFVFENNYDLPSLDAVDKYIKENKHLPEIASADEMKKDGINLSEMNIKLLQKIEELTLYMIEMKKENEKMKCDIIKLKQHK